MSTTNTTTKTEDVVIVHNYIDGKFVESIGSSHITVTNPCTGSQIGRVDVASDDMIHNAVQSSYVAYKNWSTNYTMKARAAIILKFHSLVQLHANELAELIVQENGKNITEALADVAKGNETVEYAGSIANSGYGPGKVLPVSSGNIICEDKRLPIGVVVSIVPFNFPFMVPMWTIPIALVLGNTIIVKPSEKVPLTLHRTMSLWEEAGLPSGCINLIQGSRSVVEQLIAHPKVNAITFVGSSPVAESIAQQCSKTINQKRCIALGGAKNHLIALSDCHITSTAQDIVTSFCGCAGQRCMAASVLLLVNNTNTPNTITHDSFEYFDDTITPQPQLLELIETIRNYASKINPGTGSGQMGPVIDAISYNKIISYIELAEKDGAKVLLDGRISPFFCEKNMNLDRKDWNWIGPTILLHTNCTDRTMVEEIFGPVLSIYYCKSWDEAIQIENNSPFGNAASIYTTNGGHAQYFLSKVKAAMLGCNIGIPVPREPFSFGGLYGTKSKFGSYHGDITGDSAIEFFTNRIKVTTKWPTIDPTIYNHNDNNNHQDKKQKLINDDNTTTTIDVSSTSAVVENNRNETVDHANFAGRM